jgi:hypothetical protein
MLVFGLHDTGIGVCLVLINLVVLIAVMSLVYVRYIDNKELTSWKRGLTAEEFQLVNEIMTFNSTTIHSESFGGGGDSGGDGVAMTTITQPTSTHNENSSAKVAATTTTTTTILTQHLVQSKDVVLKRRVGAGAFGEVFRGTYLGKTKVAVKTMLDITETNVKLFKACLRFC